MAIFILCSCAKSVVRAGDMSRSYALHKGSHKGLKAGIHGARSHTTGIDLAVEPP